MLPIVLGFVAGLVLGALAFVLLKGGLLGLGVGAVVAVLGYVAVSALAERPRSSSPNARAGRPIRPLNWFRTAKPRFGPSTRRPLASRRSASCRAGSSIGGSTGRQLTSSRRRTR